MQPDRAAATTCAFGQLQPHREMPPMPRLRLRLRALRPIRASIVILAALCVTLVVGACGGPRVIQGLAPFVGIASMRLTGGSLETDFRIANQNEVIMTLQSIDMTVTVDSGVLVAEKRSLAMEIDPSSSEELRVNTELDTAMRNLLGALESQAIKSVSFELEGKVQTLEDGLLRFAQRGHLYPVPGKPGHFRSAVTRAEGLQREDPF